MSQIHLEELDNTQDFAEEQEESPIVGLPQAASTVSNISVSGFQEGQTSQLSGFGPTTHSYEYELLMKPLPILDFNVPIQEEPSLLKAFKRQVLQAKLRRQNEVGEGCPHISVENWVCKECNNKVSSFGCIFDSYKGKVQTFMKVLYENQFLEDFLVSNASNNPGASDTNQEKEQIESMNQYLRQSSDQKVSDNIEDNTPAEILYRQYQPANTSEMREYMLFIISKKLRKSFNQSILGPGHVNNLSSKLINYLQENDKKKKKLLQKYNNENLIFDSIFESGNLLQAELITPSEYQLYMQVDTNTRGHQQWFHFRVKNTKPDRKYIFRIMNFTKSGLTLQHPNFQHNNNYNNVGGLDRQTINQPTTNNTQAGLQSTQIPILTNQAQKRPSGDHLQKIHYRSKLNGDSGWQTIDSDQLEFIKTSVQRRRKDILAAAADSDQEEINEGEQQDESQKLLKQKSPKKKKPQFFYALQFEVQFSHANDSVYFSYALPYTLSEMTEKILLKEAQLQQIQPEEEIKEDPTGVNEEQKQTENNSKTGQVQGIQGGTPIWQENNGVTIENEKKCIYYKREIMARSVCGLPLYQITISRDSKTHKKKPVVIITSRVHAAETPSSFVFDGIYNFLCSNSSESKFLRRFYTFILIPTLNPDGIVSGNYRSSISGVDLNRQWIQPDEDFHPEIYSVKQLMKNMSEKERRQLWIYCDLHGHSKKRNSFFYGCNTAANGGFLSWTIVRLLPRIFAKKTHLFNYKDCRFKVEPYKLGTGRVVAWKQFMITHSFTLESSFYGYDFGDDEYKLFTEIEYADVGNKFCSAIYELHFLWKAMRNELKLTNGWLKPRKLIELTGVPAAQLLSEELQRKKKEEQKRKAIENYEQFLKKFFNKSEVSVNQTQSNNAPRRGSKLVTEQKLATNSISMTQIVSAASNTKPRPSILLKPGQSLTSELMKTRNKEVQQNTVSENPNSGSYKNPVIDQEKIYMLLQGLVKIQALIRGFLTRKKYSNMMQNLKVQKNQRINDDIPLMRPSGVLIQQTNNNRMNKEIIRSPVENINWRNFFKDQELESAYQHVEIEKEDDPEDNLSDGSSSNPSCDNFDLADIYEQVYQLPNASEMARKRKDANKRFFQEINSQDFVDQQSMFQILDGAFKGKRGQLVRNTVNTMKNKVFRSAKKNDIKVSGTSIQVSPAKINYRRPSLEQRELSSLKKGDNSSPAHPLGLSRNDDQALQPLKSFNIIDSSKNEKGIANIQNQNGHNMLGNGQQIQYKPFPQNSYTGVLLSSSYHNYGKKESIQQVIKDCFITTKLGGNPQQQTSTNFFQQDSQMAPQRVHSMNKQPPPQSQVTNTIQYIKKQQIQRKTGSGNNNKKTPAQRLQEQRDQIRYYFNQHHQNPPGSSYDKYRAMIVSGNLASEQQIPISNINYYGGEIPQQEIQIFKHGLAASQSRSDNHNQTNYGGIFGGPHSLPQGIQDPNSNSSLFMKYVKQKLVKKVKVDPIPKQIADKYVDLYKELIEKETQRKQEEQEFLRRHQSYGFTGTSISNSFGATGILGGSGASSSITQFPSSVSNHLLTNSRNRTHNLTKTEQKPRQVRDQKNTSHHTHTSRKEYSMIYEPNLHYNMLNPTDYEIINQIKNLSKPRAEEVIRVSSDNQSDNLFGEIQHFKKNQGQFGEIGKLADIRFPSIPNQNDNDLQKEEQMAQKVVLQSSPLKQIPGGNLPLTNKLFHQKQEDKSGRNVLAQQSSYFPQQQQQHLSDQSINSSIDEEMLDKIKNIYSEMRKNDRNSSKLNGATSSLTIQNSTSSQIKGSKSMNQQRRVMLKPSGNTPSGQYPLTDNSERVITDIYSNQFQQQQQPRNPVPLEISFYGGSGGAKIPIKGGGGGPSIGIVQSTSSSAILNNKSVSSSQRK